MTMKVTRAHTLIAAMLRGAAVMAQGADPEIDKKQKDIRNMAHDTLSRLYEADPKAQSAVEGAAGYGFSATWA
jgi:hypothetical protein